MPDAAREPNDVVSIADYLRETIADYDRHIAAQQRQRDALAVRLAVMEAAEDPLVAAAAADYERRVDQGQPYEDAQDANEFISGAHSRYNTRG